MKLRRQTVAATREMKVGDTSLLVIPGLRDGRPERPPVLGFMRPGSTEITVVAEFRSVTTANLFVNAVEEGSTEVGQLMVQMAQRAQMIQQVEAEPEKPKTKPRPRATPLSKGEPIEWPPTSPTPPPSTPPAGASGVVVAK